MKVEIINTTFCKAVDDDARRKVARLLRYRHTWFTRGRYSKVRHTRLLSFMEEQSGFFLSGFLPRIRRKYPDLQIVKEPFLDILPPEFDHPSIKGITFRADQLRAIRAATDKGRGVIKFATASGKTVIAAGIISCFNQQTIFLAHRTEIVTQTWERFKEYGFEVGILTGTKKKELGAKVLCATIQSYSRALLKGVVSSGAGVVIIDEAHHVNSNDCQYAGFLSSSTALVKIGLTGTKPNDRKGRLAMEGYIGPVIATLTIREGIEKKILSKPKITLLPVPKLGTVSRSKKYFEIYDLAVVYNQIRNDLIMREVKARVDLGKSCLIIVDKIKHGEKLLERGEGFAKFLQGATAGKVREKVKKELSDKKTLCVITTNIWGEGIDLPSLNVIVLAFCGKAATKTVQTVGRVLRTTVDKKQVEIIDFLDPYKFLAEHLVQRLTIYIKEGLL